MLGSDSNWLEHRSFGLRAKECGDHIIKINCCRHNWNFTITKEPQTHKCIQVSARILLEVCFDILTSPIKHKDIHQREADRIAPALFIRKLRGNPIWQQWRVDPSLLPVKQQDGPAAAAAAAAAAPAALCNITVWNYTHCLSAWLGRNHSD